MATPTASTSKRSAKTKTATPKAMEPAPTPTPTQAPATQTETQATEATAGVDSIRQRFEALIKSKQDIISQLKTELADLRKLQRDHETTVKELSKKSKKKVRRADDGVPRKPSGFASPVTVSDDLYAFLSQFGVKKGTPIARTDVTRYVTSYIKQNNLQNPEHRREIVPDAALKKLFGPASEPRDADNPSAGNMYTYLKMQRYISHHFPKKASA